MSSRILDSNNVAYAFISLKGQRLPLATTVEDITRPGINGQAFRVVAKRSAPADFIGTVDCDNQITANNLFDSLIGLQGSLISVEDDYGKLSQNCMLLKVAKQNQYPIIKAVGGLSSFKLSLLIVRFTVQQT